MSEMRTAHSQVGLQKFLASMDDKWGVVDTASLSASVLPWGKVTQQCPGQVLLGLLADFDLQAEYCLSAPIHIRVLIVDNA